MTTLQLFYIYKATNKLNSKSYIGFTKSWPSRRRGHKCLALSRNGQLPFHKAIRRYGFENFEWEILFQSWDREYCLNVIEPLLIEEHSSLVHGYNVAPGGGGKTATMNPNKGKTFEEIYGEERSNLLKNRLREKRSHQFVNSGPSHYNFDPVEYHLIHQDGRHYSGTRHDFRIRFPEIARAPMNMVFSRTKKSYKGWSRSQGLEE